MVYKMIHEVTIGEYNVTKINNIEISNSIETFTNTAVITLPKRLYYSNKDVFTEYDSLIFKKGDVVKIKLGYLQGSNKLFNDVQFTGFVSSIEASQSLVEIHCEDYMYFLKKTKFNFSADSISLQAIAGKITEGVNKVIPTGVDKISVDTNSIGLTLQDFKATDCNGVEILQQLKKYTLDSFFTGSKLRIGINYSALSNEANQQDKQYTFTTYNKKMLKTYSNERFLSIIDGNNLKYQKSEDVKLKMTAKVFTTDGKYYEKSFGDSDGQQREFLFHGDYNEAELESLVKNQVERLKYDGFQRGSTFITYGLPMIQPMNFVNFDGVGMVRWYNNNSIDTSKKNVYEKSTYMVNNVTTTYSLSGFRQVIGISNKVNVSSDSNSIANTINAGNTLPS